jgi:acyl-coenzyme A thioesterase PaaI-like protein
VLDIMRAIRDGRLPPPPIARLIGFHYVGAEPREIVIELQPEQSLENAAGTLHAGMAAAMLDNAIFRPSSSTSLRRATCFATASGRYLEEARS